MPSCYVAQTCLLQLWFWMAQQRIDLSGSINLYLHFYNYTGIAQSNRIERDEAKNRPNQRKHGLSFEEAAEVFLDPLHVSLQDRIDDGEIRWQTFGMVRGVVLVMVAHTWLEEAKRDCRPHYFRKARRQKGKANL